MKVRHILIVLVILFIHSIFISLFQIMHWPYASEMFLIGFLLKLIFGIMLLWKLITSKKLKKYLTGNN